jgi:hypothetical protein
MNYTWKLKSLKKINTETVNNAVVQTFWTKTGTDENGNEGIFQGTTPFELSSVDPNNFVNYEDLTEEIVLEWIKSVVVGDYEEHVNEQIQKKINEKINLIEDVKNHEFPWNPVGLTSNSTEN